MRRRVLGQINQRLSSRRTLHRSLEQALGRSRLSLGPFSYHALSPAAQRRAGSTLRALLQWAALCWRVGTRTFSSPREQPERSAALNAAQLQHSAGRREGAPPASPSLLLQEIRSFPSPSPDQKTVAPSCLTHTLVVSQVISPAHQQPAELLLLCGECPEQPALRSLALR